MGNSSGQFRQLRDCQVTKMPKRTKMTHFKNLTVNALFPVSGDDSVTKVTKVTDFSIYDRSGKVAKGDEGDDFPKFRRSIFFHAPVVGESADITEQVCKTSISADKGNYCSAKSTRVVAPSLIPSAVSLGGVTCRRDRSMLALTT
jgi:hypothetical protein